MNAIEKFEGDALQLPQVECPLTQLFADGVYWREILIPAGCFILGHEHKTEHFNVMLTGKLRVLIDGKVAELAAPQVFVSPKGIRKLAYAIEDTRWANVHPNPANETDMDNLEDMFISKSPKFLEHELEMKLLKEGK